MDNAEKAGGAAFPEQLARYISKILKGPSGAAPGAAGKEPGPRQAERKTGPRGAGRRPTRENKKGVVP